MGMRVAGVLFAGLAVSGGVAAMTPAPAEFRLEEVPSAPSVAVAQLKPNTVLFSDHRKDAIAESGTGLMKFENWARLNPVERQYLSLFPGYVEPVREAVIGGVRKPYREKLHIYVAEARFVVPKAVETIELTRYVKLPFLERIDPAITHKMITPAEAMPLKDPDAAGNRNPRRGWCEPAGSALCIQSRYQLEGQLPLGMRLLNKFEGAGQKKSAEFLEFQSELRLLAAQNVDQAAMAKLTGIDAPVHAAFEQSIFYVNQMLQFGRFLAVLQPHPSEPNKTVASMFIAIAVKTEVLERNKEYARVPVLRNLVPAQVLVGNSSFNTGNSLSAGLPIYARSRVKAVAAILGKE
jgi:hypothetical protein